MRILVIQLARFGDIYQSWPTLNALQRQFPEGELHLLVRERFQDATLGLERVHVHAFPSAHVLEPLLVNEDENASVARLETFMDGLAAQPFDRVINLSFSPLSSFLTEALTREQTQVSGYTRHADGYLNIADDTSAYFYAQARLGGSNRFHITELFAAVAGVELQAEDYRALKVPRLRQKRILIHLGASQAERIYPAELWMHVLKQLAQLTPDHTLTLIGGAGEEKLARVICEELAALQIDNQANKTTLSELMELTASSRLVIGADSAPAQMASLTQTPVLMLASEQVNFWTTGPTSAGSRVLYAADVSGIKSSRIAEEAVAILAGQAPRGPCVLRPSQLETYVLHELESDEFAARLLNAMYTQADFPTANTAEDLLAFQRLYEISELALQHLEVWTQPGRKEAAAHVLNEVDKLLIDVEQLNAHAALVVRWFQTERLRIPPGDETATLARTQQLFKDLMMIASVYRRFESTDQEAKRVAELCRRLAPSLREFNFASVQGEFQDLVSTLHELSRHSTKVGDQSWSALLSGLNEAMVRRDLIEIADQLEYVLAPALS